MSIVHTEITLKNAGDLMAVRRGLIKEQEIRQVTVNSIVDTGAWTLVINEATREKLGLDIVGTETGTLADGSPGDFDLAGPVEVRWKNRRTTCEALVLPDADDILLGAIPLEAMDLTINPRRELVGVHGDQIIHKIK
ncbi:MAG: aspartyl protease family protein [Treponema sp.]|nr:aspartyl protease family protein [Treponema sp.]